MNMNLNEIITKKMEAQVLTKTSYKNFLFNWSNSLPMLDYLIKKKCGAKTDLSLSARIITECDLQNSV